MMFFCIIFIGLSIQQEENQTDYTEIFKKLLQNEQLKKGLTNPDNIRKLSEGLLYKENENNRTNCLDLIFEEYKIFKKDQSQQKYQQYIKYMDFILKLDKEMLNVIQRQKIQSCFSLYRDLLKQLATKRQLKKIEDQSFFDSNAFSYGTLSLSIVLQDFKGIGRQIRNILEKNLQPKIQNIMNVQNKQQLGIDILKCVEQKFSQGQQIASIFELIQIIESCYTENKQFQQLMKIKLLYVVILINNIISINTNQQYDIYINMFQKVAKDFLKFETYKQILQGFFQKEKISFKCLKAIEKLFNKIDFQKYQKYQFTMINIETILNIDQILKENNNLTIQCKSEIKDTILNFPDTLQKLSLQLISNVDNVFELILNPKNGISTGLGLGLIMKNYKGIGQSLRKLVDKISDMPVHIQFDKLNQQDMTSLLSCMQNIQIFDLMNFDKILKSTQKINQCIKNELDKIKQKHTEGSNKEDKQNEDNLENIQIQQQQQEIFEAVTNDQEKLDYEKVQKQQTDNKQLQENIANYQIELNLGDDLQLINKKK